jgi:2-dehydropantoate 2-reductase
MWSNEGNRTRQNDDESSGEDKAAATHYPVKLLMRSHHKSRLISMRNEMNNRQCWFAPVTIRKGATTVTTSATSQHHDERIITQCIIPVEFIENGMSRNNNDNGDNNGIRNKPIHCLVLATKANDAIAALESVWDTRLSSSQSSSSSHSSPSPTKIIILSNGALAIRDAIYNRFGRRLDYSQQDRLILDDVHLILGTTTHGAHKTSPRSTSSGSGNYDITHAGIGCTACTDMQFTQLCRSIGWDAECLSMLDMHVMLWKKLAVNCVINPLTAIHNVTNGQLLSLDTNHHVEDIITTTRQILDEVSLVARMEMRSLYEETMSNSSEDGGGGYDENNNNIPPRNQWLLSTTETLSSSSLEKFVYQVMDSTKDNISSMLQDVRSGKATEVRFLNGYVASLGQEKYGMDCSRNLEMCRLVEELHGINPR